MFSRQLLKFRPYLQICRRVKFQHKPKLLSPVFAKQMMAIGIPFFVVQAFGKKEEQLKKEKLTKLLYLADELYDATQYKELFTLLQEHKASQEPEVLWRFARALFEMKQFASDHKEMLSFLEEALETVTLALEIDDTCGPAHKWRGILLDYVCRHKGIKARLINSFIVKEHLEKAIKYTPKDSTSYYILGEWCYSFAEMPWYQRKIASAIFASPPTSSFEEALSFFTKAEELNPRFYSLNLLMLGKCLLRLNDKDQAIGYLQKACDYPQKTNDDKQAREQATKILKELGISL